MRNALVPLLVSLLWAHPACADVIGADWQPPRCPELTCAPGSAPGPSGSHSGCSPGCGPGSECATDADCAGLGDGARCVETAFCIGEGIAARLGPVPIVRGECGEDGSCAEGECSRTRRCEAPPPAANPAPPPSPPVDPDEGVVVEGPETDEAAAANEPESAESEPREGGGCAAAGWRSSAGLAIWLVPFVLVLRRFRPRS